MAPGRPGAGRRTKTKELFAGSDRHATCASAQDEISLVFVRDENGGMVGIRDVSAEAVLLGGGARAILLQLANPVVARGVARHSDFAGRPLDRLHGTLTYLYVIVFGTPDEAQRVARSVGEAHRPVRGDGYDARDVDAQVWVAATIYDSAMRVHDLVLAPVASDELVADYAIVATTLGVPPGKWPATRAAFDEYWRAAPLEVGDDARSVANELLYPRSGPLWLRVAMPTVRVVTAGLLSPELREAYGLPFNEKRFERLVRFARVVYPRLPKSIRQAPMRRYLKAFRQSSADRS